MEVRTNLSRWLILLCATFGLLMLTVACSSTGAEPNSAEIQPIIHNAETSSQSAELNQTAGTDDYNTVISVLTSPRCINCHPSDDRPRQRDEQIDHILLVERGADNHGGPVQTCSTCHHEENNDYSNVPGAPHWGLAPKSMGWLGLSDAEIAATLIDPAKNGERSFDDLIHHMSNDALVLWAWNPGEGRTTPPVPHDEFVQALTAWLEAGAPIPSE